MNRDFRKGFTLIEILAAMAVLMILVLLVGQVFNESIRTWRIGTRRALDNAESRAVLDFMARDISQAVADDVIGFRLDSQSVSVFGGWQNDGLYFVSLSNESDGSEPRAAREIRYYVEAMSPGAARYRLRRAVKSGSIKCYDQYEWWQSSDVGNARTIAENIGSFEVWCYAGYTTNVPDYNSNLNTPSTWHKAPRWVEVLLTVLGEDDAIKADAIFQSQGADAAQKFVNRNAKRHEIRINLENWNGYGADR